MTDYFDNYFFTSNLTHNVCPGFSSFECKPPNACARDPNTGKRYCCDYGDVCWTVTSECANDGSTLDCGSGSTTWCCIDQREKCTESPGQINICWSTAHNTLTNISSSALNETFSSLSSAKPSASSWTFDPVSAIKATAPATTTSNPTATVTNPTTTATSSPKESSEVPSPESSTSLSGGAIAGIVIGVIAAIALLALGIWLIMWRKKKSGAPAQGVHGYVQSESKYPGQGPQELYGSYHAPELQGDEYFPPQELPANSPTYPQRNA